MAVELQIPDDDLLDAINRAIDCVPAFCGLTNGQIVSRLGGTWMRADSFDVWVSFPDEQAAVEFKLKWL